LNFKREEMYRDIGSLSGGQKAKLFFAKMNLNRCEVLVLDEPTRNLSPLSQDEVIKSFNNYNGAIISVSHDRYFIENVSDKVYELDEDGLNLISG
ncbi:MAG: ATP-binding cassette domain-containing protein, partial [Streptococcus sp.]|nr:ATP-binding cassette domain-containing protein [Streptococcus sp.]